MENIELLFVFVFMIIGFFVFMVLVWFKFDMNFRINKHIMEHEEKYHKKEIEEREKKMILDDIFELSNELMTISNEHIFREVLEEVKKRKVKK